MKTQTTVLFFAMKITSREWIFSGIILYSKHYCVPSMIFIELVTFKISANEIVFSCK
jgi:hypothetical protein